MIEREEDRAHCRRVVDWFFSAATNKYARGIKEHGGHLPDKGGLLAEAEAECLDLPIYVRTLREQLERIERFLEAGRVEDAMVALAHILHGTPRDRLPAA